MDKTSIREISPIVNGIGYTLNIDNNGIIMIYDLL